MLSRLSCRLFTLSVACACAFVAYAQNAYVNTVLVANHERYEPLVMVDPLLENGWGIAIRPPGAGGHFWISNANTGTTTVYVGDVHRADGSFMPLFQDELTVVEIPQGHGVVDNGVTYQWDSMPTGQVFNHSGTDFVVSGEGVSAASKFIFVNGDGTISGWTEKRDAQGVLHRQTKSVIMVDNSHTYNNEMLVYTGCAITDFPNGNKLYVTNTLTNEVEVYDHEFRRLPVGADKFRYPITQPMTNQEYHPWNIHYLRTGPNGEGRLWVMYIVLEDPWEEDPTEGAVAEFDLDGNFIRCLTTPGRPCPLAAYELRAPWGIALAPSNFGPFSNTLLIANFTDGTIPAFNRENGEFIDFLRDVNGEPISADGVWGILFGNGVALGDTNALYYAAGPEAEVGGTFGTIRWVTGTCPRIATQPTDRETPRDESVWFHVNAPSPVKLAYQWQTQVGGNWVDITDGVSIAGGIALGTASEHLLLSDVTTDAVFRVRISNDCGEIISEPVSLAVSRCASIDFNNDCVFPSDDDVMDLLAVLAGNACATCDSIDFNGDGVYPDDGDTLDFFRVLAGGSCE